MLPRSSTRRLRACSLVSSGDLVRVVFEDGLAREFHRWWLADNCSANVSSTTQKIANASDRTAIDVRHDGDALTVAWTDGAASSFDASWLRTFAEASPSSSSSSSRPTATIPVVRFSEADARRDVLANIHDRGIVLLRDVVDTDVAEVARDFLGPVQNTLYGRTFDVRTEARPINIAYSEVALPLHMDLAYYESPPGLQLLHCLVQAEKGGANYFVDAHAAAESFRVSHPEHFETLRRTPATFQKDHADRATPARYFYRRPHIVTGDDDAVTAVFWSPPFEGPLRDVDAAEAYYPAYRAFRDALEDPKSPHRADVKMRPNDLIVWNQRRLLHGRTEIRSGCARHLRGCYVNIDDFLSTYRVVVGGSSSGVADLSGSRAQGNRTRV